MLFDRWVYWADGKSPSEKDIVYFVNEERMMGVDLIASLVEEHVAMCQIIGYLCDRISILEHFGCKGKVMDKQIRKIEKETKRTGKDLKKLERMDKKRDKVCDLGKKVMKAKKKKK